MLGSSSRSDCINSRREYARAFPGNYSVAGVAQHLSGCAGGSCLCSLVQPDVHLFCTLAAAKSNRVYGAQVFGFELPAELPGVPAKVLNPREAWSDKDSYDATRTKLAGMFKDNFTKFVKVRLPARGILLGGSVCSLSVVFVLLFLREDESVTDFHRRVLSEMLSGEARRTASPTRCWFRMHESKSMEWRGS